MQNISQLHLLREEFHSLLALLNTNSIANFEYEERDLGVDNDKYPSFSITAKFHINTLSSSALKKEVKTGTFSNHFISPDFLGEPFLRIAAKDKFCMSLRNYGHSGLLFGAWFEAENGQLNFPVPVGIKVCSPFNYTKEDFNLGMTASILQRSGAYSRLTDMVKTYNNLFEDVNEYKCMLNRSIPKILEEAQQQLGKSLVIGSLLLNSANRMTVKLSKSDNKVCVEGTFMLPPNSGTIGLKRNFSQHIHDKLRRSANTQIQGCQVASMNLPVHE